MEIEWSEQSRDDLRNILLYVAENFGRRTAEAVLADIRSRSNLLKDFPMLGRVFVKDPEQGIIYRHHQTEQNSIFH
ncbi:MAG: type II toxin-antitoxin system RelE/ParE family toxin [Salinivirgaceae bacterium]|nr:type II toxin-antitoxin system RelE/ParE family toxin [Salinivirgaceae bacterium]